MKFFRVLGPKSQQSFFQKIRVHLRNWFWEHQRARYDLVILSTLSCLTFLVLIQFDFFELFSDFTRQYEAYDLDEILFVLLIVAAIYFPIFAIRRWNDATRYLQQSNIDSLTGLFNRRKSSQSIELEINRAKRHHRQLSIILFDIDHFKLVNDKFGHLIGDRVLKQIAKTTQEAMRSTDILTRWGGEEFLIITPEIDVNGARLIAERMRQKIEEIHIQNSHQMTASFGVTQLKENDTVDTFFQRVDDKLYLAKSNGRNRVEN